MGLVESEASPAPSAPPLGAAAAALAMPIQERIDWLFGLARRHSAVFAGPESFLARRRYLALHPTAILVLKCMDGRINFAVATRTPIGIIQPFRNLGGIFNLGWPHLGEVLTGHVMDVIESGRRALVVITYHFSRGDPRRGCAGFNFDREAALAHARTLKSQVETVFGTTHASVYPVVCGFETDEDALILHGAQDATLDASDPDIQEETLAPRLAALYPDMPVQMRDDLLPLLVDNRRHVAAVRGSGRQLDFDHREWVICVGRGFDFLQMPNLALIIGPYSPDLADPIRKAAGIIRSNMEEGRIPGDGFLLLASSPYQEAGVDSARARMKARFLSLFAAGVIREEFPDLAERMNVRTAVLHWGTRALEALEPG